METPNNSYKGYKATIVRGKPRYIKIGERGFKREDTVPEDVRAYFSKVKDTITKTENTPQQLPLPGFEPAETAEPTLPPEPSLDASHQAELDARHQAELDARHHASHQAELDMETEAVQAAPYTQFEMELISQIESLKAELDEKEDSRDIYSLAKTLYEDFGVYTVWCGEEPGSHLIHPFTGSNMTRYEAGVAYQARKRAESTGSLVSSEEIQSKVETLRESEAAREVHEKQLNGESIGEVEGADYPERPLASRPLASRPLTFDERTSVEGQKKILSSTQMKSHDNDPISEEPTAEMPLYSQTVRRYW